MPIVREFVERAVNAKPERGVDPMEAVAAGAAIQAGVLAGEVKDLLLLDVTPLTLGIETLGGIRTPLIPRNTTIPTKKSQVFSTAEDNQPAVTIHVLQGEREMAADNKSLGRFELTGIPPAPRGIPQIEVTFDIDANGIINVTAKDKGTGKQQEIRITSSEKLSDAEVAKMQKEAEQFAEEDKKRKEQAETRNQAENLVYTIEKSLNDYKGKLPEEQIKELEKEKEELQKLLNENNSEKLKTKMDDINKKLHEAATKMYQEASKEQQTSENKKDKDNVVDAEIVDEDKKE